MKHILKTTAIGGMSMLCCFVLEAMDIDPSGSKSNSSENISIPAGSNLRQVSELDLFDQNIRSMEELKERLVGIDLNSVQTLILSQNPITSLEGFPEFLPKLQRLYMVGCQLKSLEGFPDLPALRVLSLENNQISDLGGLENVFPDLEELYLSNNKILCIWFKLRLNRLKKLDLSWNQLENIAGDLRFLTGLERLNLSNNQLRWFHYEWNNLKSLNLSNNRLESRNFGREFGSCENLIELDLSNNQLVCDKYYPVRLLLPSSVDNLERLQLEGNGIPEEEIIKASREMPNCNISFQDNEGHRKAAFGGNITILDAPGAQ